MRVRNSLSADAKSSVAFDGAFVSPMAEPGVAESADDYAGLPPTGLPALRAALAVMMAVGSSLAFAGGPTPASPAPAPVQASSGGYGWMGSLVMGDPQVRSAFVRAYEKSPSVRAIVDLVDKKLLDEGGSVDVRASTLPKGDLAGLFVGKDGRVFMLVDTAKIAMASDHAEPIIAHELKHLEECLADKAGFIAAIKSQSGRRYSDRDYEQRAFAFEALVRSELIATGDSRYASMPTSREASSARYALLRGGLR